MLPWRVMATAKARRTRTARDPATPRRAQGARDSGPAGIRPTERREEDILQAVMALMDHRMTRQQMAWAVGRQFRDEGVPEREAPPRPLRTLDDDIVKAKARWAEVAEPTRDEARKAQLRRLYARLATLKGANHYREAADLEKLIARIEGTEAAKVIHVGGAGGGPLEVKTVTTSDERRRRVEELEAKARDRSARMVGAVAAEASDGAERG